MLFNDRPDNWRFAKVKVPGTDIETKRTKFPADKAKDAFKEVFLNRFPTVTKPLIALQANRFMTELGFPNVDPSGFNVLEKNDSKSYFNGKIPEFQLTYRNEKLTDKNIYINLLPNDPWEAYKKSIEQLVRYHTATILDEQANHESQFIRNGFLIHAITGALILGSGCKEGMIVIRITQTLESPLLYFYPFI